MAKKAKASDVVGLSLKFFLHDIPRLLILNITGIFFDRIKTTG